MIKKIFIYYLITLAFCFSIALVNNELALVFGSMLGMLLGGCVFYIPIIYGCGKWVRGPRNSAGLAFLLCITVFWALHTATTIRHVSYTSTYGHSYDDLGIFLGWVWVAIVSSLLSRKISPSFDKDVEPPLLN